MDNRRIFARVRLVFVCVFNRTSDCILQAERETNFIILWNNWSIQLLKIEAWRTYFTL